MASKQDRGFPLFSPERDRALLLDGIRRILEEVQSDPKKLKKLTKAMSTRRFLRKASQALASAARDTAPALLKHFKADAPAMLEERRAFFQGFQKRLYKTWKHPLDLLEMMIVCCAEAAEHISAQWPWDRSEDQSLVFDVVRRLQARGCLVASEILTLLKAGYAPAAHARWRSLHELAATAFFLGQHGKDVAERFLAHEHVEAWKAAQQYQKHCRKLRHQRFTRKEMAQFRRNHDAALKHYGKDFKNAYGWAAAALGRPSPTFADIEEAAKLQHLRPYYKMASYPVHATVKSIRFSLALRKGQDILLTGPSNWGLTDPGHSTAISLGQVTTALASMWPTTDSIVFMRALLLLVDEIGDTFLKAQKALERKGRRRMTPPRTRRGPHR